MRMLAVTFGYIILCLYVSQIFVLGEMANDPNKLYPSEVVHNIEKTNVSKLLADAYEGMDNKIKREFPNVLHNLQKFLFVRDILNQEDIPKTTGAIVELLAGLNKNEAVLYLLEKALNIKAPVFPHLPVGNGYNVFQDSPLETSPLKRNVLQHSDIGFMIPNILTCNSEHTTKDIFYPLANKQEYIQDRMKTLGVSWKIPEEKFTGEIKPGYTIKDKLFANEIRSISASREFRLFEFVLNHDVELTEIFVKRVNQLSPLNSSDYENVEDWKNFFNEYGTHVVSSVHGGGSINIELSIKRSEITDVSEAIFILTKIAEYISILSTDQNTTNRKLTPTVILGNFTHKLTFTGGDQKFHSADLLKLKFEEASKQIFNWRKSLQFSPDFLTTEMKLMPISQLVQKKMGNEKADFIQAATNRMFNSTIKYTVGKHSVSGIGDSVQQNIKPDLRAILPRSETPFLLRMKNLIEQSNKQIQALMMALIKQEENSQKRIRQREKERLDFMEHQKELNKKLMNKGRNLTQEFFEKLKAEKDPYPRILD